MPGLVGGHCIGVDPYYLAHKASSLGLNPNLILTSRAINNSMSKFIAEQTIKRLIENGKNIKDAKILILGVTFKENCPDVRNTKVTDIGKELLKYGTEVTYSDPWVTEEDWKYLKVNQIPYKSITNNTYDGVIVAVNHSQFIGEDKAINAFCTTPRVVIDVKGSLDNPNWRL